ncbi:MAG: DNA-binding protein, partial [Gammaproteobacteria bacterium]|nr:DNA-binding protein [Gammaproteobacteria bacterium]
ISNKSPLWRWSSVAEWLYKQGKIKDQSMVENANFLEEVNIALDLRNRETLSHTQNILNAIERKRF